MKRTKVTNGLIWREENQSFSQFINKGEMSHNDLRDDQLEVRRDDANLPAQDKIAAQEEQGVVTGQEAEVQEPPPDEVTAEEPWDETRYEQYILTKYSDYIDEREQIPEIHTTSFVIGRFLGHLEVIDDNEVNGRAFMRTPTGPVEFRRGPMAWNPSNRDMLEKLCRHVNKNQNEATRIGYEARGDFAFYTNSRDTYHFVCHRSISWSFGSN